MSFQAPVQMTANWFGHRQWTAAATQNHRISLKMANLAAGMSITFLLQELNLSHTVMEVKGGEEEGSVFTWCSNSQSYECEDVGHIIWPENCCCCCWSRVHSSWCKFKNNLHHMNVPLVLFVMPLLCHEGTAWQQVILQPSSWRSTHAVLKSSLIWICLS